MHTNESRDFEAFIPVDVEDRVTSPKRSSTLSNPFPMYHLDKLEHKSVGRNARPQA